MTPQETRQEIIALLAADRWRAHKLLFAKRHPQESAPAHKELVARLHSRLSRILLVCFRGFGKTTYTEEAVLLGAAFREFENKIIVGASYTRACERLAAIKRLIEQNEHLEQVFGDLKGPIWQEGKIVLSNGICIQAVGREQSMRGTKHLDKRPDSATIDDIEDRQESLTPAGRQKIWDWLQADFVPALDHPIDTPIQVLGTILNDDSLVVRLMREEAWKPGTMLLPVEFKDPETGARRPTWEAKFSLHVIDKLRRDNRSNMAVFEREYMCNAAAMSQQDFTADMIRVREREPQWQAVYAMYDPARTTRASSATTGKAVWSWDRRRLIVWEGGGERWKPDEIINDIFMTAEKFDPVWIGVEEDGLNEFIRQPLRQEMARRGLIPFKPVKAPRGKLDFIRALQPFFNAGEVEFAKPLPELQAQLLSFPTGDIDGPNALAYALTMRPGAPIYEEFRDDHIAIDLRPSSWRPVYLAANARDGVVTAMLLQAVDGQIRVFADWVCEGSPEERVSEIHAEAGMEGDTMARSTGERPRGFGALKLPAARMRIGRQPVRWVVPGWHYDKFLNVGLVQAVTRIPANMQRGGAESDGREYLRDCLARVSHGEPMVQVSQYARWTLRALSGGYSRAIRKSGLIADEAEPGPYRVLMEGFEAFLGMIRVGASEDDEDEAEQNYAYDNRGRRYKSAMPARG